LDTGAETGAVASKLPTGTPRVALGADVVGGAITASQESNYHVLYNRSLSNAELTRAYKILQVKMALRGVTI
jgi:hypothetical protein